MQVLSQNTVLHQRHMHVTVLILLAAASLVTASTVYDLVEEGEHFGRGFQRFVARDNETPGKALTSNDWTDAVLGADVASLSDVLRKAPYSAFYFEVVPVTDSYASIQPFEFILMDAPSLAKGKPRFRSFEGPCSTAQEQTKFGCIFSNL